jgi:4'-phosphopantetheinyl transferase
VWLVRPGPIAARLHVSLSRTPGRVAVAGRDAALRRWVRKEAYLKGLGTGLGLDPATVDLSADPPGWHVAEVDAGPGLVAAVAVMGPRCPMGVHRASLPDLVPLPTRITA